MKFRARKTFRLGKPGFCFTMTLTQSGSRSYGIRIGPFTHNFTRRTTSINTPGPGGFHHQHGRRS